jgi:hypothetical protein
MKQEKKRIYIRPALVSYGSVRNLTGGSGAQGSDATTGSMSMSMMA